MIRRSRSSVAVTSRRLFGGLGIAALTLTGCTDAAGYDLDYIIGRASILSTMRRSVSYEAQQLPRLPAPGSVPLSAGNGEMLPTFTQTQLDSVGAALTNPFPVTPELIERGEVVFQNQCFVCHGAQGAGNGPVVGPGKFPMGPSLVDGTALARSDGYIYGIIRVGRGLMPSYAERINHADRWAVVAYVNQLQGLAGGAAAPAPVPAADAAPAAPAQAPAAAPAAPAGGQ